MPTLRGSECPALPCSSHSCSHSTCLHRSLDPAAPFICPTSTYKYSVTLGQDVPTGSASRYIFTSSTSEHDLWTRASVTRHAGVSCLRLASGVWRLMFDVCLPVACAIFALQDRRRARIVIWHTAERQTRGEARGTWRARHVTSSRPRQRQRWNDETAVPPRAKQ